MKTHPIKEPFNTDQLVLIGRDSREDGLREDEGLVLAAPPVRHGPGVPARGQDQVNPRLKLVHRIQDDL